MDVKSLNADNAILANLLADKVIFNALFNVLDIIHLFAIAKDGSYIIKNKILDKVISKLYPNEKPKVLNAKDIDPVAWNDCYYIMETGKTKVQEEQAPNGRYYLSVKSPLVHNNEVIGIIGIAVDITDKKQAELAKEEFLANMSHDLRIPFSGIASMADYLYQQETDPVKKQCLEDIVQSSKGFLSLLTQILECAKADYQEQLMPTVFNLQQEIAQLANMFQAELKMKQVDLVINCPHVLIQTDKLKLSEIILNLLGNAVKFTERGSVHIKVKTNPYLVILVKDTGIGINKAHQPYIFDKFYKVNSSYKTGSFKGFGLGLYAVQKSAKALGGFVTVKSQPGKGSSFTLSLPVHPEAA
jgi:signal transduction histidine kinase